MRRRADVRRHHHTQRARTPDAQAGPQAGLSAPHTCAPPTPPWVAGWRGELGGGDPNPNPNPNPTPALWPGARQARRLPVLRPPAGRGVDQNSDDVGLLGESPASLSVSRHARVVRSAAGVDVDQEVSRDRKGARRRTGLLAATWRGGRFPRRGPCVCLDSFLLYFNACAAQNARAKHKTHAHTDPAPRKSRCSYPRERASCIASECTRVSCLVLLRL